MRYRCLSCVGATPSCRWRISGASPAVRSFPRSAFGDVPLKRLCVIASLAYCSVLASAVWIAHSQPFFAALFPGTRARSTNRKFAALALAHFWLVGISSLFAVVVGVGAGMRSREKVGKEFRPGGTITAVERAFPPV